MKDLIRLQSIGLVKGTPASEIKIGDVLVWNFGHTSTVKEVKKNKTGNTLHLTTISGSDGKEYERKIRVSTLVCIAKNGKIEMVC